MRILIALVTVLLIGCESSKVVEQTRNQKYQQMMDSWVGAKEDSLIGRWGVPKASYVTSNTKFLTYIDVLPTIFYSGVAFPRRCETTFSLRDGIVVNWRSQGHC